jgi:hypothetical protein
VIHSRSVKIVGGVLCLGLGLMLLGWLGWRGPCRSIFSPFRPHLLEFASSVRVIGTFVRMIKETPLFVALVIRDV